MKAQYFGTDGIRGKANQSPMTADVMMRVAMAAAIAIKESAHEPRENRVVIGKDTRLSGYMLEQALASGFEAVGMNVTFIGPMPTPAVAMLTRSMRADLGVMISASHNPFNDNGVKFFGPDGHKISDALQNAIEEKLHNGLSSNLGSYYCAPEKLGKASRMDDAPGRYIEFIKASFPRGRTLKGMKIALDCAHGAAYKIAPQILWELEAELVTIGVKPDGRNINEGCGATDTMKLQETVTAQNCDLGIALDGDADRLIMVDETGTVIDGDQLMALLATDYQARGILRGNALVATVMSNLGLERYLKDKGLDLIRTAVGDRAVIEAMREGDYNLGGEQSGHIIIRDYAPTGDGILAALQILGVLEQQDQKASEALNCFSPVPQILKNVRIENGAQPLDSDQIKTMISETEHNLAKVGGRLLVRPSGTEPLIRVMAEGDDQGQIEAQVDALCDAIAKAA